MSSGNRAKNLVPIQFIDSAQQSSRQTRINRHLVRSHVSKLNRRKAKTLAEEQLTPFDSSPKQLVARAGSEIRGLDGWDVSSSRSGSHEIASAESDQAPIYFTEDGTIDSEYSDLDLIVTNDLLHESQSILDLRTISPFLGAISTEAFTNDASFSVSQSADYFMRVIVQKAFVPAQAWLAAFFNEPVVYHAFAFVNRLHLLAAGCEPHMQTRLMLEHQSVAIRLLNEKLAALDDDQATQDDVEVALLGIYALYPSLEEIQKATRSKVRLFVPHLPDANAMDIYINNSINTELQRSAIDVLIRRSGGVANLKLPGLPKATAINDLILASHTYGRPNLPWLWSVEPFTLLDQVELGLVTTRLSNIGSGFVSLASELTHDALSYLGSVSCINLVMAQIARRGFDGTELSMIVTARDTVHHRLLSLPSWDELVETEKAGRNGATYECCRITAILYSHCVLFPISMHNLGVSRPIQDLRKVVESTKTATPSDAVASMLLWMLLVAALASFGTEDSKFFTSLLAEALKAYNVPSLEEAVSIAKRFVWSDCACSHGATVMWDHIHRI